MRVKESNFKFITCQHFCMIKYTIILPLVFLLLACSTNTEKPVSSEIDDPHSFSRHELCRVVHLDLDLKIDFEHKKIIGFAEYQLDSVHGKELVLDNMGLMIESVEAGVKNELRKVMFSLGKTDPILGTALQIPLDKTDRIVRISYHTTENAMALQWVPAQQTAGKQMPFLFTQSQSIYARSWIPCPDGPGMRFSYTARIQTPKGMMAIMSAQNPQSRNADGQYSFKMDLPVPAYLLALAVGDFDFKAIGNRTGVYAAPGLIDDAAWEFGDLENMLVTAEKLYGPYPWGRYDVLVLPSSFPFGGMENPCATFLTPTVLAGDKSLTSLLAHELAHSWSGNLVTNQSWNDFWLNEGFTTYIESRIMDELYGQEYADMLSLLGLQDLNHTLDDFGHDNHFTCLKLNLENEDPEEAMSDIAYEKGKALLRFLEERKGRSEMDNFLKAYFEFFKFRSNTTEGFLGFLQEYWIKADDPIMDTINEWLFKPGPLPVVPNYSNARFAAVESQMASLLKTGEAKNLNTDEWTTHEWLHFIRSLPKDPEGLISFKLDERFKLKTSRNAEIRFAWLKYNIDEGNGLKLMDQIDQFLCTTGRRKFLTPLYESMINNGLASESGAIFKKARDSYHPIAIATIEKLFI